MSRIVALAGKDGVIFATTLVDSEFPATPPVLLYQDLPYLPFEGYGQVVPGHPEIADLYVLSDFAVVMQVEPFTP